MSPAQAARAVTGHWLVREVLAPLLVLASAGLGGVLLIRYPALEADVAENTRARLAGTRYTREMADADLAGLEKEIRELRSSVSAIDERTKLILSAIEVEREERRRSARP